MGAMLFLVPPLKRSSNFALTVQRAVVPSFALLYNNLLIAKPCGTTRKRISHPGTAPSLWSQICPG